MNNDENQQYTSLISEVIKKQSVILGPEIAILKARSVKDLVVENDGKVVSVGSNPKETLQKLVDQYVELSGQIVKNALGSIFAKYSNLNINTK
jgi:ribosomal protein L30E